MLKIKIEHIKAANPPQFARLLGVTTSSVYRWLDGGETKVGNLQKAAKKLDIPFDDFFALFEEWLKEERQRRSLQKDIENYFNSFDQVA